MTQHQDHDQDRPLDRPSDRPLDRPSNRPSERPTEDDIQREKLGPRGVPGAPDPARMTPQRDKKTPKHIDPGQTA